MSEATIDYGAFETMTAEGLSLVSRLVADMRACAEQIASVTAQLESLTAQHRAIEQRRLPDALKELGLTELTLADGTKLSVTPEYHVSIPAARREEAFTWLRENGLGDIIKTLLIATYGRGEEALAQAAYQGFRDADPDRKVELGPLVHPQTLKALVKERFEAGAPVPEDLFGVFIVDCAKLKAPKTVKPILR